MIEFFETIYIYLLFLADDLIPILNERAGYPPNTRLSLYEEVKAHAVQEINTYNEPLEKVMALYTIKNKNNIMISNDLWFFVYFSGIGRIVGR